MPTTRAMARRAPSREDDKENEDLPNLRKKPVRRATAKSANAVSTKQTKQAAPKVLPLSPKKVTQVGRARRPELRRLETPKSCPASQKLEAETSKPRRAGRSAKAVAMASPVASPGPSRAEDTAEKDIGGGAQEQRFRRFQRAIDLPMRAHTSRSVTLNLMHLLHGVEHQQGNRVNENRRIQTPVATKHFRQKRVVCVRVWNLMMRSVVQRHH